MMYQLCMSTNYIVLFIFQINNLEISSPKSKSYETLYNEENTCRTSKSIYMDTFNQRIQMPMPPPSRSSFLEASMIRNRMKEPIEPVLQSKDLFNTLIDSPCTKLKKIQYNNILSSGSKFLLNRHLESVKTHPNVSEENYQQMIPNLIDFCSTPKEQDTCQSECQTQTSNTPLLVEEIEELKTHGINNIRQTKLQCCDLIKTRFNEIELEVERLFSVMENNVAENYNKLLKKVKAENNDSTESQTSTNDTVETVKEKNYTRMTGAFGILNNLNTDCSFLKTPKAKGKTREEMLNSGFLTPSTMSFVLQEQLMHLNSSS